MDLFQSIILGIIEGFTEFLPISSTGHLIVASEALGLVQSETNKAFEVIIQLAAILAVVANYKDKFHVRYTSLWIKVIIAFFPLAIVGFIFKDEIKAMFTVDTVAVMFIIGGVLFLIIEYFQKDRTPRVMEVDDVTYGQAIWIGIAQVFALIPGTSRAGSTIIGALLVGLSRKASAEFSFLLALPVMATVSGYDLLKHYKEFSGDMMPVLAVGFITSFLVAWVVMKLFIKFLERFTFNAFGIYRIVFGAILLYLIYTGAITTTLAS
ncbi:MAG TPA: undecaprenyl-diphosphate phosphatase [Gammaproteobacteria bacterium]|nr:undecaprenyl-diphosphate phosphatase [Gammaproteobacteria bacterium]